MSYNNSSSGGGNAVGNQNGNNNSSSSSSDDSSRKVFIGGLTIEITAQQLRDYFGQFGEVEVVDLKTDKYTGQPRGYGFITFVEGRIAEMLVNANNPHFIGFHKIEVKRVSKKSRLDCKIFVGGVSQDTSEIDVRTFFTQFGNIVEFEQPFDKVRNAKKNFCFVTFATPEEVKNALQSPKQIINGKQVDVKSVIFNPETMGNKNERRIKTPVPTTTIAPYYAAAAAAAAGYNMAHAAVAASAANYASLAYEAYGPAYGGYDYNALGYDPNALGYVGQAAVAAAAAAAAATNSVTDGGISSAQQIDQRTRSKENSKTRYTPY